MIDAMFLDLSGVSRCDSAGVAMVVEWVAFRRSTGGALAVQGMPGQMRAILDVSDLVELVSE